MARSGSGPAGPARQRLRPSEQPEQPGPHGTRSCVPRNIRAILGVSMGTKVMHCYVVDDMRSGRRIVAARGARPA